VGSKGFLLIIIKVGITTLVGSVLIATHTSLVVLVDIIGELEKVNYIIISSSSVCTEGQDVGVARCESNSTSKGGSYREEVGIISKIGRNKL